MLNGYDDDDIADLEYLQQLTVAHDEDDDPDCMLFSFLLLRSPVGTKMVNQLFSPKKRGSRKKDGRK